MDSTQQHEYIEQRDAITPSELAKRWPSFSCDRLIAMGADSRILFPRLFCVVRSLQEPDTGKIHYECRQIHELEILAIEQKLARPGVRIRPTLQKGVRAEWPGGVIFRVADVEQHEMQNPSVRFLPVGDKQTDWRYCTRKNASTFCRSRNTYCMPPR